MRRTKNFLFAIVALSFVFEVACTDHPARAADLPDYMKVIVGDAPPASATDVANQNVLALDLAMFGLYDDAQAKFQKNFLAEHPIVLAPVQQSRRQAHPDSSRQAAIGRTAGTDSLSNLQIRGTLESCGFRAGWLSLGHCF